MPGEAPIRISDGCVEAVVRPAAGGGLARFDCIADGRRDALFRPEPAGGPSTPFDLACNILVPWSNRVSGGGFSFGGQRYALAPNLAGEPYPLHGNGFLEHWAVVEQDPDMLVLRLDSPGPGPYRYGAQLTYRVAGAALTMALQVENHADTVLPYGVGFHPWLVRDASTTLCAPARTVWLEGEGHLPLGTAPVPIPPEWDFSAAHQLPANFINNGFAGWSGTAEVNWPERGLRLRLTAGPPLDICFIYSPGAQSGFFCLEPVSHPVDGFNLPGGATANGLVALAPGAMLAAAARFAVERTDDR